MDILSQGDNALLSCVNLVLFITCVPLFLDGPEQLLSVPNRKVLEDVPVQIYVGKGAILSLKFASRGVWDKACINLSCKERPQGFAKADQD